MKGRLQQSHYQDQTGGTFVSSKTRLSIRRDTRRTRHSIVVLGILLTTLLSPPSFADDCLTVIGKLLYTPPVYGGNCMFAISRKPSGSLAFVYDKYRLWEHRVMWERGTDGSNARTQIFKLDAQRPSPLATETVGFRVPFDDLWDYFPVHPRGYETRVDRKIVQRIRVFRHDDHWLIMLWEWFPKTGDAGGAGDAGDADDANATDSTDAPEPAPEPQPEP